MKKGSVDAEPLNVELTNANTRCLEILTAQQGLAKALQQLKDRIFFVIRVSTRSSLGNVVELTTLKTKTHEPIFHDW